MYRDGHREKRLTGRNGIAAVPLRSTALLEKILLSPGDGLRAVETLLAPVTSSSEGNVFKVRLDSSGLTEPFFRYLRLTVENGALLAPEIGGKYVRE